MGKKAKTNRGKEKANRRKVDKATLPEPPAPVKDEVGSQKLLDEPKPPGSLYKALDQDGYDDGGVADLTLVIDLEDYVMRRKRGENAYFTALKADLLPRVTQGQMAGLPRREQKIRLAKLLFSEEDEQQEAEAASGGGAAGEAGSPSEVYKDVNIDELDDETKKKRLDQLNHAKFALRLSALLREAASASLSLAEISKRYLACQGKDGAEAALRCATKAVEIASDGFYDSDEIAVEAEEEPKINPKHEKNATYPGLGHPTTLKLQSIRVSHLCLRSALLHKGNALSALDRNAEAREVYQQVMPMLDTEPRCDRLDWERSSIIVNVGNTYSREGDFDKANEQYDKAERLGKDHVEAENGNKAEGMGIMVVAMRARAFALKKAGREEEAKEKMREVLELQKELDVEQEKQKAIQQEYMEKEKAAEEAAAAEAAAAGEATNGDKQEQIVSSG